MPRQSIVLIKAYCPFILLINKKASLHDWHFCIFGGDDGIRTHDPLVANYMVLLPDFHEPHYIGTFNLFCP